MSGVVLEGAGRAVAEGAVVVIDALVDALEFADDLGRVRPADLEGPLPAVGHGGAEADERPLALCEDLVVAQVIGQDVQIGEQLGGRNRGASSNSTDGARNGLPAGAVRRAPRNRLVIHAFIRRTSNPVLGKFNSATDDGGRDRARHGPIRARGSAGPGERA